MSLRADTDSDSIQGMSLYVCICLYVLYKILTQYGYGKLWKLDSYWVSLCPVSMKIGAHVPAAMFVWKLK